MKPQIIYPRMDKIYQIKYTNGTEQRLRFCSLIGYKKYIAIDESKENEIIELTLDDFNNLILHEIHSIEPCKYYYDKQSTRFYAIYNGWIKRAIVTTPTQYFKLIENFPGFKARKFDTFKTALFWLNQQESFENEISLIKDKRLRIFVDRVNEVMKKLDYTADYIKSNWIRSKEYINALLNGEIMPALNDLVFLSELFNVSVDYLVGTSDLLVIQTRKNIKRDDFTQIKNLL